MYTKESLEKMKVTELNEICKNNKIKGVIGRKKESMIEYILCYFNKEDKSDDSMETEINVQDENTNETLAENNDLAETEINVQDENTNETLAENNDDNDLNTIRQQLGY